MVVLTQQWCIADSRVQTLTSRTHGTRGLMMRREQNVVMSAWQTLEQHVTWQHACNICIWYRRHASPSLRHWSVSTCCVFYYDNNSSGGGGGGGGGGSSRSSSSSSSSSNSSHVTYTAQIRTSHKSTSACQRQTEIFSVCSWRQSVEMHW